MYLTKYTIIRRIIFALQMAYPEQFINRKTIINCLSDLNFQSKYVKY